MDQGKILKESDAVYPVLLIPKQCTTLETNCEAPDNVFIELNISSPDIEGNEMCIYSGFCNVKLIDSYDVHQLDSTDDSEVSCIDDTTEQIPPNVNDPRTQVALPPYSQSQVWIDPVRSPYVYNQYDAVESQEYSIQCHQTYTNHITVEQHNTYITQNVYNCKESINYASVEDFEHKKFKKVQMNETSTQHNNGEANNLNMYEEDEFECGVFLSQLPEEIMNEKENRARVERKYIGLQSENGALQQLMSTDIQSATKQRKTILFLGHDSHCGQTIQKIAVNDPSLECFSISEMMIDHEVEIDGSKTSKPHQKKYQCDKCKQIFDQISTFKLHMVGNHKLKSHTFSYDNESELSKEVKFMCTECGKSLKTQQKFEIHCMAHGDPDLECDKCHKVFASKFTLRTHLKIHTRKYPCSYCSKTYSDAEELRTHAAKMHFMFMCDVCDYLSTNRVDLALHRELHKSIETRIKDIEPSEMFIDDVLESDIITIPEGTAMKWEPGESGSMSKWGHMKSTRVPMSKGEEIRNADSVIAKVMSNEMFLLHSKRARRHKRYNKTCDVCLKEFDRIGDLKRHLIEHVIRCTLAKTPVSVNGTLNILCEVCQAESFTRVDRYKAHLREHAKLTLYKCTFCDKSFSDSSNFSKHKKIHGTTYLQCDLCQRKFNSKKMIQQHMEYHNKNTPVKCKYCHKLFHFASMLNKHIKCAHTKEVNNRFKCRFCNDYFKTLKEKWDHEWTIHNVRKMIVDCLICGSKFRKYSELKRHCLDNHGMDIPPAKKLLKRKKYRGQMADQINRPI